MAARATIVGVILAIAGIHGAPTTVFAQDVPGAEASRQPALERRAQDVVGWLRGEVAPDTLFSAEFLRQIPAESLAELRTQLESQFGEVVGVESIDPAGPVQARIAIRFERAIGSGTLALADTGEAKIAGLQLSEFAPLTGGTHTPEVAVREITASLDALPGNVAAWFGPLDGGDPIFAFGDAERQFALGSAFKLYVLGAVSEAVADGRLAWDQVVMIGERSFPSGIMQDWPQNAPATVQTLATLMISISDNTATDALIRLVGRERVEDFLRRTGHSDPARSLPFLTTRELFLLKTLDGGAAYAAASEAGRRRMLETLDGAGTTTDQVAAALVEPRFVEEIEWFASMEDERRLLAALVDRDDPTLLDILAVNPQLSAGQRAGWAYVGFKGGSEPGGLNLTWLLRDRAGRWHMLAASWSNERATVDSSALGLAAVRILALKE